MPRIKVGEQHIEYSPGECENLLQLLLSRGIEINHSCGGMGSCGTCRVFIRSAGELSRRTELESDIAQMYAYAECERLSCQLTSFNDAEIDIP